MAVRNADASRERILEAAMAEFAQHGIAGARVDRIATAAGCNKNLIYVYFESKETLFATLLQKHLVRLNDEVQFSPEDLPAYAMRVFDFAMANPQLMRLLAWFGLEQREDAAPERRSHFKAKVTALLAAQQAGSLGDGFAPPFLLTAIISLATAWTSANPFGLSIDPDASNTSMALRETIGKAVTLLATAQASAKTKPAVPAPKRGGKQ